MLKQYTDRLTPYGMTILRIMTGFTFFMNGLSKVQNIPGTTGFMAQLGVPLPGFFGPFIAILETFGGLLLIVGLGTRYLSLLYIVEMIVTTVLVKSKVGFIAPRGGGAGSEIDLMLLAAATALVVFGAGVLSLDHLLLKSERAQPEPRLQTSP